MERLNEQREPRNCAGVNFRRVQRFRNVKMIRDNPVEKREDDEVEHDRDDHFMRAELHSKKSWNRADNTAADCSSDHAERNSNDRRN